MITYGAGWDSEDSPSSSCSSPRSSPRRTVQTPPPARPRWPLRPSEPSGLYLSAYLISLAVLIAGAFLWYLRDVVAPDVPGRRLANLGFAGGHPLPGRRDFQRRCIVRHGRCRQARRAERAADAEHLLSGRDRHRRRRDGPAVWAPPASPSCGAGHCRAGSPMSGSSSPSHRSPFRCSACPSSLSGCFSPASWFSSHRNSQQSPATRSLSLTSTAEFQEKKDTQMRRILVALTAGVIAVPVAVVACSSVGVATAGATVYATKGAFCGANDTNRSGHRKRGCQRLAS